MTPGFLLLFLWQCTASTPIDDEIFTSIPDGLLVRQDNNLKHCAGQWNTIVVFHRPEPPARLGELFSEVQIILEWYRGVSNDTSRLWQQRWNDIARMREAPHLQLDPVMTKRGLINARGWPPKQLFGVATEDDVDATKRYLNEGQNKLAAVIHKTNELVTVVNKVQHDVQTNRRASERHPSLTAHQHQKGHTVPKQV